MAEREHGPFERAATAGVDKRALSEVERATLDALVTWARAIDGADSYAGFTLCAWARARPGSAEEALEDRLHRETNRIGVSNG